MVHLIDALLADHRAIKRLFALTHLGGDQASAGCELAHLLVVHEVAEEELVYPAFRRLLGVMPDAWDAEMIADVRLDEQREIERWLLDLERVDPGSMDFARTLEVLEETVLEHQAREETGVFRRLRAGLEEEEMLKLGDAYLVAKASAPTHPHPHLPKTQLVVPILALIDRARDAARSVLARH